MLSLTQQARGLQESVIRRWNLRGLGSEGNRLARAVVLSAESVWTKAFSPQELTWLVRIETLRGELNASTQEVLRRDFGAGNSASKRTQEEQDAGVEVADTLGRISKVASKPPFWCRFLFKLVRTTEPRSCVEMGTAVGISAAYQAAALKLNGQGSLTTMDGAASLAEIARRNLRSLGLDTAEVVVGKFQDTLPGVLEAQRPIDYVFIDGHHDEQATKAYFEQILPFLADAALLVFDDIHWSEGMSRAWNLIGHDRRVGIAVDFGPIGVCIVDRTITRHKYYTIPL
jgi:predicted O-methyltransferase YrrM